jgi:hypothetical protein
LNNQEKQKVLEQYYFLDQQIERKILERDQWCDRANKITSCYFYDSCCYHCADHMEQIIEQIGRLQWEINLETSRMIHLKDEIEQMIYSVENDTLQLLLEYRYLDHMTWEEIAEKMHYDIRWLFRLHKKALSLMVVTTSCEPERILR